MAEITKLSVGQALEKLSGTDAPKAKMARLDEKIDTLDQETQRLRAMRHRIERDQRAEPVIPNIFSFVTRLSALLKRRM